MVSVIKRMRILRALLALRLGPGAVILPPEVTRIHMEFASKIHDGHIGPRKFWKISLPRMKFHNPAVPMTVNLTEDQDGPAVMTVQFTNPASTTNSTSSVPSTTSPASSKGSPVAATPVAIRTETIQMKHKHESEILSELLKLTNGQVVSATPEETQEIQDLENQRKESEAVSLKAKLAKEARKRAEAVISQARESADAA